MYPINTFTMFLPPFMSSENEKDTLTNEMLSTFYSIPSRYRNNGELSRYYILRWSYAYFILQPDLEKGVIYHQGQRYKIAYGKEEREIGRERKKSVMLSFRCPSVEKQKDGLEPTCYITILS